MSRPGSEADLEAAAMVLLAQLGWETVDANTETPGQLGRQDRSEPVLKLRLVDAAVDAVLLGMLKR